MALLLDVQIDKDFFRLFHACASVQGINVCVNNTSLHSILSADRVEASISIELSVRAAENAK